MTALEAKLEQTERRLQETIARYEEILQNRPEQGCVITTEVPAVRDASANDD